MKTSELTDLQRLIVEDYSVTLSQTATANNLAVSVDYVNQALKLPKCNEYLSYLKTGQTRRTQITADRVLQELARIAFVDPRKIVTLDENGRVKINPMNELDDDDAACISEIHQTDGGNIRIKMNDKIAALQALGKHLKLFTDVSESNISFNKMGRVVVSLATGETKALAFDVGTDANELKGSSNDDD